MNDLKGRFILTYILMGFTIILLLQDIIIVYFLFSILVFLLLLIHNIYFLIKYKKYRKKTSLLGITSITLVHIILFQLQLVFIIYIHLILAKLAYLFILTVIFISNNIYIKIQYTNNKVTPIQKDLISFSDLKKAKDIIENKFINLGNSVTTNDIKQVLLDLPRHSIATYVNNGTLTDEFFKIANNSLNDKYIYIVVSNTGSPASKIISKFTQKKYNHVSLSLDSELKTILSYNGGEKILPPGLNKEEIEFFNQKDDASILVYRLAIEKEQKLKIINTIKKINEQGSAYNILGLVFQTSLKPNIMFCSQFVYKMLECADINYFEKKPEAVRPYDFIELDYSRKLEFCYELYLNDKLANKKKDIEK